MLTEHCRKHFASLRDDPDFRAVLSDFPEFAVALISAVEDAGKATERTSRGWTLPPPGVLPMHPYGQDTGPNQAYINGAYHNFFSG